MANYYCPLVDFLKCCVPYLEVVVSLEVHARLHLRGVELDGLQARVATVPVEHVPLDVAVVDVRHADDDVGQTQRPHRLDLLLGEQVLLAVLEPEPGFDKIVISEHFGRFLIDK